jgi:hypothetical protein
MRLVLVAAAVVLGAASAIAAGRGAVQIPAQFTNLEVFPRDVSRADLIGAMMRFTSDLDVRCDHCHVGDDPDFSTFDFASDAKPAKAVARRMLRMTAAINADWLGAAPGSPPAPPKVTCFTCHRGAVRPLAAPGGGPTSPPRPVR